jgi:hypothetical protein
MAQRHQRGWLKKEKRAQGETWVLFFRTTRKSDGKRVENKIPIGLIQHLPDASSAWAEVERLHVPINRIDVRRGLIFGDLAQHYAEHELAEASESIRPKAHTTIKGYERVLRNRLLPRWGHRIALGIEPSGAAFASSTDFGKRFSMARVVVTYTPFVSRRFSGNGARECGDGPFACPTGFTFPRFDLAGPYLAADNVNGTLVMAFQAAQSSGQGQIESMFSTDGGGSWSSPTRLASNSTGHQFYPFLAASAGRVSAIWYDSRGDTNYSATRPPCNSASGQTSACLNVRYAESTDGGKTWGSSIQVSDTPTNLNYEQFGGRRVPFFGDYITVAAQGDTIGATWTDQRNTVGAADTSGDNDSADVAGDPETGGSCTSSLDTCFDGTGGLDQNIYAATITP